MLADPAATPVTVPLLSTVAIAAASLCQPIVAETVWPLKSIASALKDTF